MPYWSNTWTSGRSFRKPHYWKQLITVWSKTFANADLIHETAFKLSTYWMISVVFTLLPILEITNFKSFFRYLNLIIPSKDWSLDAVFFGKKTTLILEKRSLKLSGWHGTLSMKSVIFLLADSISQLILANMKVLISVFIYAFWLKW